MAVQACGYERKFAGQKMGDFSKATMWKTKNYTDVVKGIAVPLSMFQILTIDDYYE